MVQSEQHVIYKCTDWGLGGAGRLKITWKKLMEKDCREWKLRTVDPQERGSGMRSVTGRESTDVDDAPAH